MIASISKF